MIDKFGWRSEPLSCGYCGSRGQSSIQKAGWSLSDREQQRAKHFKCHRVYSRKMALEGRRRPRFSFLWFRRTTDSKAQRRSLRMIRVWQTLKKPNIENTEKNLKGRAVQTGRSSVRGSAKREAQEPNGTASQTWFQDAQCFLLKSVTSVCNRHSTATEQRETHSCRWMIYASSQARCDRDGTESLPSKS